MLLALLLLLLFLQTGQSSPMGDRPAFLRSPSPLPSWGPLGGTCPVPHFALRRPACV